MEKTIQLYEGKAKKVYATDDPSLCIVSYKDDATAFNGAKKGTIAGKGAVNNRMTNMLMNILEKSGVPTHLVRELSDRETLVRKVSIVPLEVIIRNVSAGSFAKRFGVNEGIVFEVQYDLDVDPALPLEENLERAEAALELMHAMVEDLDVPFEEPALSTFAALPEPFRQEFLEGSLYDEIIMNPNELENPDGVSLFACFWTQDEQDWSDAVGAYISLSLECE